MKVDRTALPGVVVIEPRVFNDERGSFSEVYHAPRYAELGLPVFVQDNVAVSRRGVVRGLHYQWPRPQGKLVYALAGSVFDVAVDVRPGSPTFRHWVGVELSASNRLQLYIPPGFAHGYAALEDDALVAYKCTDVYVPEHDRVIRWDDASIAVEWPVDRPVLSEKDRTAPSLDEAMQRHTLPEYAGP